jgi:hypothetical protein
MSLFMAGGGIYLGYLGLNVKKPQRTSTEPRHPVTEKMIADVRKLNKKPAPFFKLPDSSGKPVQIGGSGPMPQFIYSIKKGCPCSFDFEPAAHKVQKLFAGKIEFIAVSDMTLKEAQGWVSDFKDGAMEIRYPVIPVPKLEVMKAYDLPASVFCTLVDKNGIIVKRWPGYSQADLRDMIASMAKLLNEKAPVLDVKFAPLKKTSGCAFEGMTTGS